MGIPVLIEPEEIPVRTTKKRPHNDQRDPQDQKPKLEGQIGKLTLIDGVVTISFFEIFFTNPSNSVLKNEDFFFFETNSGKDQDCLAEEETPEHKT